MKLHLNSKLPRPGAESPSIRPNTRVSRRAPALRLLLATAVATALVAPALVIVPATAATTYLVDSNADTADVNLADGLCATAQGTCTLRAAVQQANSTGGNPTIELGAGTYSVASTLVLTKTMTIVGARRPPGTDATTIQGGGSQRVFDVAATGVTIEGVVVRNGNAGGGDGGGVLVETGASLTIERVTVTGNTAAAGGGIANNGTLTIVRSTINANVAGKKGGGIWDAGNLDIVNSTVDGNSAAGGGGIASSGTTTLSYATISGNTSTNRNGGGVYRVGGTFTISRSIIAGNHTPTNTGHDCYGSPSFAGENLVGNDQGCNPTGSTTIIGDPLLSDLADNGGATMTRAIPPASPAVNVVTGSCGITTDQRDVPRPATSCDLGAFEYVPQSFSLDLTAPPTLPAGAQAVPLANIPATALSSTTNDASTVGSAPLGAIDLSSSPLGAIPLGAIPLGAIPLGAIPLGAILLSDLPVTAAGGWAALLAGTPFADVPLETLTLLDVLDAIADVPIEELGLGSTPLGAIPLGAIALGSTPLGAIPLGAIGTEQQNLETWCSYLGSWCATLGINPADTSSDDNVSLVSLALAGVPLGAIPLGAIPLGAIPLGAIPLGAIPLGAIPLGAIPLGAIPLGAIALAGTPLGAIPLGAIPLGAISTVVDCTKVTCSGTTTLADAAAAGALIGTLADLYALDTASTPLGAILLRQLFEGLPDGTPLDLITLDDILPGLVVAGDLPWQRLDLDATPLQGLETNGPAPGSFSVAFAVGGLPADVELKVTLPPGFRYVQGSASVDGASTTPTVTGTTLTVALNGEAAGSHTLTFDAWAGLELGRANVSVDGSARTNGTTLTDSDSGPVDVVEAFEGGDSSNDVVPLTDATLHLAHLSTPGDEDWYKFTVPPGAGQRVSIMLANLPADYDLVLFGPDVDPLRGAPMSRLLPIDDGVLGLDTLGASLPTETHEDIPLVLPWDTGQFTVHAVSANRGTHDEQIDTALLRPGDYYVQVSGYNGASSTEPFSLRIRHLSTLSPSACPALSFNGAPPSPASTLPQDSAYAGADTLFLVNRDRLTRAFPNAAPGVLSQLAITANQPALGVNGVVVPVDADPDVAAAYAAWDHDPCNVDAANDVVRQIGALIDHAVAASAGTGGNPTIRRVVVIGADDQIPLARIPDATLLSNERSYGPSLGLDNAVGAALSSGHILTDNAYGSSRSIAVGGRELFVPELDLGRLVESPAEILRTLTDFVDHQGVLDTSSALVTGYDFLTDGAQQVVDGLKQAGLADPTTLINESWTRQQLASALQGPGVASLNAHFDEHRALPAAGNATGNESDLYTIADLPADLRQSLLFSMGCHSGLNVPDISIAAPDWASALAQRGASWVANTGFGYGDTDVVALSERLMANFASGLSTATTVGEALTLAKQQYLSELAAVNPYDEKVVQQVVFYGLPMWRLPSSPTASLAATATRTLQALPDSATFDFPLTVGDTSGPGVLHEVVTDHGRYYEVDGQTVVVQNRPIQPKLVEDVTRAGVVAHGALITGLESVDRGAFDPVYARPTVDSSASETERQIGDAPFPAAIQSVRNLPGRQTLVLVPGQFRDPVPGTGIGTQRLFTSIQAEVQYADPANDDFVAPTIERTSAGSGGAITVETDDTAARVIVLVRPLADLGHSTWVRYELQGAGGSWSTTVNVPTGGFELFVQAVDDAGNVSVSSGKALNFATGLAPTAGEVRIDVLAQPSGDWYKGPVSIALTSTVAGPLFYSIDGGAFVEYTGAFTVADGNHVIEARDSTGGRAAIVIGVDGTPPTVTASTTPTLAAGEWTAGSVTVAASATDALSGVAFVAMTATGAGPATTTTVGHSASLTITAEGVTTVESTATDNAGNASAAVSTTVQIDRSGPVVVCAQPGTGWYSTNPSFACTATDSGSGLAHPGDASFSLTTSVAAGTETANASAQRQVCDNVNNCTTAQVSGVKVDLKAPTIAITTPIPGAVYDVGSIVTAAFTCSDGGSGVASCSGTVANGSRLPTSTAGARTFTVTASDAAGNPASATVSYVVGFHVCLLYDPTKPSSVGSTYPIKLQLCDRAGTNLSSSRITLQAIDVDGNKPVPPNFSGSSNLGYAFRYDTKLKGYIYNLSTDSYLPGSHWMDFTVDGVESDVYRAEFTLS